MTSPTGDDDAFWRRPNGAEPTAGGAPGAAWPSGRPPEPEPRYAGPPPTLPPPPGWQPPFVVQPLPPRRLPEQNHEALDEQERSARTITYGIGMIAGAILLVLMCVLCSRWLF